MRWQLLSIAVVVQCCVRMGPHQPQLCSRDDCCSALCYVVPRQSTLHPSINMSAVKSSRVSAVRVLLCAAATPFLRTGVDSISRAALPEAAALLQLCKAIVQEIVQL
jgi:hypothetical protein